MSPSARDVLFEYHLSAPVQAFMEGLGWAISREVKHGGKIADLVGRSGDDIAALELKLTLGLDVILQAINWLSQADFSWVAVPLCGAKKGRAFELWQLGLDVCRERGIGVIAVRKLEKLEQEAAARGEPLAKPRVAIVVEAVRQRHHNTGAFTASLQPEHKDFSEAAGVKGGRRWNATQRRYRDVRDQVQERRGEAALADVARALGFHPKRVHAWATASKIVGVQLDSTGVEVLLRIVPDGQEAPVLDARQMKSRLPRYIPQ